MLQKENNPWRGLASYSYSDSSLFFGREQELDSLLLSIRENYCTILYGVSGAGKTSLINAGLCPRLKGEGFLPVVVRLDHSSAESYSRQILRRCLEELSVNECDYDSSLDIAGLAVSDTDRLWLFFHTSTFWSPRNEKITPCVFIDQFEEIFSLNQENPARISTFFEDFNQVYQYIPADNLLSALNDSRAPLSFSDRPSFRLALSLREDFLSRLEDYCQEIPFLRQNRRRLNKLTGEQAYEVITRPIPEAVGEDAALHIISKVSGKAVDRQKTALESVEVDTSILSLFCSELYNKAVEEQLDAITTDLVLSQGDDILTDFYTATIAQVSKKAVKYLESHLLTANGFRNQLALEDIDSSKVSEKEIDLLESSRLIRKEILNGTTRIEFSHDVLCKIASAHRASAKERGKSGWERAASLLKWVLSILCLWLLYARRDSFFIHGFFGDNYDFYLFPFGENAFLCNSLILCLQLLLLFIYWGLLALTSKKKSVWYSVCSYPVACLALLIYLGGTFYGLRLGYYTSGRFVPDPTLWLFLISLILTLFSFIQPAQKVRFSAALKNAFSLKEIRSDASRRHFVTGSLLFMMLFFIYRATTIKVASLSLVTLLMLLLFFPALLYLIGDELPGAKQKRVLWRLSVTQGIVIAVFFLSLYTHIRLISYAALGSLFVLGVHFSSAWFRPENRSAKMKRYLLSALIWLVFPLASLGFSLFALGDNAIATQNPLSSNHLRLNKKIWNRDSYWPRYCLMVDREGCFGIISNKGVLLEPQFYGIELEYKVSDAEFPPYPSWVSEQFRVKESPDAVYSPWGVMYHLDNDNYFTRKYLKSYAARPTGVFSTRNILNSYKDTSGPEFDDIACRMFLNELNFFMATHPDEGTATDDPLYRLFTDRPGESDRESGISPRVDVVLRRFWEGRKNLLPVYNTDSLFNKVLSNIKAADKNSIGYAVFSEAFGATAQTAAFESAKLREKLEPIIREYIRISPYQWKMHSDLAALLLKNRQYEEAETEARSASQLSFAALPSVYLIEALVLQEKYEEASDWISWRKGDVIGAQRTMDYEFFSERASRSQSNDIYVGDMIVQDTARFPFTESGKAFIERELRSYGRRFKYSTHFSQYAGHTLLCTDSSTPGDTNWYDVVVRKGDYASDVFERITLSDYSSFAVYFKGDKRGYLDLSEADTLQVFPALYDHAWVYSEGLAVVSIGVQLMFIDEKGRVVATPEVPVNFKRDLVFKDGALLYSLDDYRSGLLGKDGRWLLPPEYEEVGELTGGYRRITKDGLHGLVKNDGTIVVQPKYPYVSVDDKYLRITVPDGDETLTYPIEYTNSAEFKRTYGMK